MGLDVQPGHAGKTVPGLAVHRRVFDECPVPHGDQPVRSGGDSLIVGDDDQREPGSAQPVEEPEHLQRGCAVEVPGRLVGEDRRRFVDQRPGDGHALALPAREGEGQVAGPFAQAHLLEELQCSAASLPRRTSGEEGGELDVLLGGELVEEMECLEDEPDLPASQLCQGGARRADRPDVP